MVYVIGRPTIRNMVITNNTVELVMAGEQGLTYRLWSLTDSLLLGSNWNSVAQALATTNGPVSLTAILPAPSETATFYRASALWQIAP